MTAATSPTDDSPARPIAGGGPWQARVRRLEAEIDGLRRAMRTRAAIEQAKGMLAERLRIDPEQAFEYLTRLSQDTNVRVADLAAQVVAGVTGDKLAGGADPAPPPDDAITATRIHPPDASSDHGHRQSRGTRQPHHQSQHQPHPAHRIQLAAGRAQIDELRRELYPPPEHADSLGDIMVVARQVPGSESFRGDFYDVARVDDSLLITVGDVFDTGASAAQAVVRLRHSVRAMSLAGVLPRQALALLNRELASESEPPLASLVVARIRGADAAIRWAQAGHFPPVLVRGGRARPLIRPAGFALGLDAGGPYGDAELRLRPSDVIVFYTGGVLDHLTADPVRRLARGFARAVRAGGPSFVLDRFVAGTGSCLVAVRYDDEAWSG